MHLLHQEQCSSSAKAYTAGVTTQGSRLKADQTGGHQGGGGGGGGLSPGSRVKSQRHTTNEPLEAFRTWLPSKRAGTSRM